ncbi:S8 family peptidase [Cohnella thermotolerans]|uniref:S8 family peptidase n=1 Tax=Cohnella thermotolerans TaxID=329858 RepID=UPI000412E697|nr:S8 family peptidase [Cohnella thermotolerans]
MSDEQKSHFWIPDEEVQRVDKTLRALPTKRNVSFSEHGSKLSHSLQAIKQTLEAVASDNSLADSDLLVFNIELPQGEKIQDKQSLFDSNGMKVRAVKNVRSAIVTSTSSQFQTLRNRVDAYTRNGSGRTYFDFIEDFKPYIGSEKNSSELRKLTASAQVPVTLDIQLMLIPNLENHLYHSALTHLIEKINETRGHVHESPYYLSDNTPVVRAIIPSNALTRFENDSAIYRIEKTDFFNVETTQEASVDMGELELDPSVNLEELPIVAVLDSGVMFPESLSSLIIKNWVAPDSSGGDSDHGTKVASRVAFKYINQQLSSSIITPRTRILDCNILDGNVPVNIFIQRIQAAVSAHSDIVKIYNLSANASSPIEGDEMSIIGYELDALQSRTGVQFFVSAGNHKLWQTEFGLEDILDDDDSRISAPADSMLSVVVGSIIGADHQNSLSQRNQIAPYSRRGPGFQGFSKPDLSAYAGTIILDGSDASVPNDPFSMVISKDGRLIPDAGTSFSAPIVAGDYAEILNRAC